jgi:hypothetical protein
MSGRTSKESECPVGVNYAGSIPHDRSVARPASAHYQGLRRPTGPRQPDQSLRANGDGGGRRHGRAGLGVRYAQWPQSVVAPGRVLRSARHRPALRQGGAPPCLERRDCGPGPRSSLRLRHHAPLHGLCGPGGHAVWPGAPLCAL